MHANPVNWVGIKTNVAVSHFELAKFSKHVLRTRLGFSALEEIFAERDLAAVLAAFPEVYMACMQGTDLIRSLDPDPGYVGDWIAQWVPAFADREHPGVPSLVLATIQNDIATVCQDHGTLADAIELYRRALTTLDADDTENRGAPEYGPTSLPPPVGSEVIDADMRLTTKRNLATALWMLGEERACAPHFREAIALFEEVLAAQDPAADPMDWAITQSSRARAYKELYLVEGDVEVLRLSLSAYDEAVGALPDGMDSPWHQQVPSKREAVRELLGRATQPRDPGP